MCATKPLDSCPSSKYLLNDAWLSALVGRSKLEVTTVDLKAVTVDMKGEGMGQGIPPGQMNTPIVLIDTNSMH